MLDDTKFLAFKNTLLANIVGNETEPEIIKMAEEFRDLSLYSDLSTTQYEEALDLAKRTIEITIGESYTITDSNKHYPWFESYYKDLKNTRWERYVEYLRKQKHFAPTVLQSMKEHLFKITDLIGNPNGENFYRKGLVIGDVQSGKTANYIGLMNLATDAKYKIIIVLTGTTNTLREQTQIRIQEGMGINTSKKGVANIINSNYKKFENPIYLTSVDEDFSINSKKNFQGSIESTKVPIVIVTKKNVTALKNIYTWLEVYSKKRNHDHIDSSLLLIDDEADFASVNTKKEDDTPTAINSKIRDILNLFTKSSYIGFTATPYANIFIDPKTDDEMYGQDLFPKDYIYVLGESSDYVGIQSIFSDDNEIAIHKNMLITLDQNEVELYLPLKHKKEFDFSTLPPSMVDAINIFLIANVIRDFSGNKKNHRSMLINASRFMNLHKKMKVIVIEYIEKVKKDVRIYGKLPFDEALEINTLEQLQKSYKKYYSDLEDEFSFEQILKNMNESIYRIKVAIVNANNKEVDYLFNETEGERVIVIGGFALSRGLTLEGLIISYYWRNSVMYDSLLQMGRWFGYRQGYENLCKIFMSSNVISDFKFIALATQELKNDLSINSQRGLTPKQFGIKVRSGQVGLIITSRNKMRTGEQFTTRVDFSKDVIETTAFSIGNDSINKNNISLIEEFISNHQKYISDSIHPNRGVLGLKDIPRNDIINLLNSFLVVGGSRFDNNLIVNWLTRNSDVKELQKWDIAFAEGNSEKKYNYGHGIFGKASTRAVDISYIDKDKYIVKNNRARLGSPSDGVYGLTKKQSELVKNFSECIDKKTISQKVYFDKSLKRNPIIVIYSVIPINSKLDDDIKDTYPIPLLSVGIPEIDNKNSRYVDYVVNVNYRELEDLEIEDE